MIIFCSGKMYRYFSYFSTETCVWQQATNVFLQNITKSCLYNFDPLKPHFYIVKLGFTEVYIIFLISAQNFDGGHSLELPR